MKITHPNSSLWEKLVTLVQHMWENSTLLTELTWTLLVLLPKVKANTEGIGLLEVLWKVIKNIIDTQVNTDVQFYEVLIGFCAFQLMGTAIMELNMYHELAIIDQYPLLLVFVDLSKSYDTLDCGLLLHTLEEYGAGPKLYGILEEFWEN